MSHMMGMDEEGIYKYIAIKLRYGHWLSFWFLLNIDKVLAKLWKQFSDEKKTFPKTENVFF